MRTVTRLALAVALLLVLTFSMGRAQGTAPQPQGNMRDMMKMHEQMMASMKADDEKLDALLEEMNTATGEAKVDALAAVVGELARHHTNMHEQMEQLHMHMMDGGGMRGRRR